MAIGKQIKHSYQKCLKATSKIIVKVHNMHIKQFWAYHLINANKI